MRIKDLLPGRLSGAWKAFLKLYACFAVFTYFSNTFINTYLIRATGSQDGVMWFNIALAAVQPFAMLYAVRLTHVRSPLFSQRIGLGLYACAFTIMAILGERAADYIQWLAALLSAANGFFYVTYAIQIQAYTNDDMRDESYGVQTAVGGVISLILPWSSSLLLAGFSDFTGYRALFILGLGATLLSLAASLKLQPIALKSDKSDLRGALKLILHDGAAQASMWASTCSGIYAGTMSFFIEMLMFSMAGTETVVGISGTITGLCAIFAAMAYARIVRPNNRKRCVLISISTMLAMALILAIRMNVYTLLLFRAALALVGPFFLNPPLTAYMGVVERMPRLKELSGEVHALREFWYALGRVAGIMATMALSSIAGGGLIAIALILLIQAIPILLMK